MAPAIKGRRTLPVTIDQTSALALVGRPDVLAAVRDAARHAATLRRQDADVVASDVVARWVDAATSRADGRAARIMGRLLDGATGADETVRRALRDIARDVTRTETAHQRRTIPAGLSSDWTGDGATVGTAEPAPTSGRVELVAFDRSTVTIQVPTSVHVATVERTTSPTIDHGRDVLAWCRLVAAVCHVRPTTLVGPTFLSWCTLVALVTGETVERTTSSTRQTAADVVRAAVTADGPTERADQDPARRILVASIDDGARRPDYARRVPETGNVRTFYGPTTCERCATAHQSPRCPSCHLPALPVSMVAPDVSAVRTVSERSLSDQMIDAVTARVRATFDSWDTGTTTAPDVRMARAAWSHAFATADVGTHQRGKWADTVRAGLARAQRPDAAPWCAFLLMVTGTAPDDAPTVHHVATGGPVTLGALVTAATDVTTPRERTRRPTARRLDRDATADHATDGASRAPVTCPTCLRQTCVCPTSSTRTTADDAPTVPTTAPTVERSRVVWADVLAAVGIDPTDAAARRALVKLVTDHAATCGADQSPTTSVVATVTADRDQVGTVRPSCVAAPTTAPDRDTRPTDVVTIDRRAVTFDRLASPVTWHGPTDAALRDDAAHVEHQDHGRQLDRLARAVSDACTRNVARRRARAAADRFARIGDVSATTGTVGTWSARERGDRLAALVGRHHGGRTAGTCDALVGRWCAGALVPVATVARVRATVRTTARLVPVPVPAVGTVGRTVANAVRGVHGAPSDVARLVATLV